MANAEHVAILKQGVEAWNQWRQEHPGLRPDLREARLSTFYQEKDIFPSDEEDEPNWDWVNGIILSQADLSYTNFHQASLPQAILSRTNLLCANFSDADLQGAIFSQANLRGADLTRANLSRANFTGANLLGANLSDADLSGANLTEANLERASTGYTLFCNVDLSQTRGLEQVNHQGPSTIGTDTIYKSGGNIPEVFLRGCGVPDGLIEYMRSLIGKSIEYYSCFISYSSQDDGFSRRLYADLQANNVRCWFAPEDMKIGEEIRPRIDESIRLHDKLLLVLSEHSLSSAWVKDEVETAYEQENRQKKLVLFPVRLDEAVVATSEAWAAKLCRTRNIGDFTRWKVHDAYQQAFTRLLRDLKAESN